MIKTLKSFVYVVTVLAALDSTLGSAQQVGPNVAPPQEIAPQVGMPIQSVDPSVRSNIADQTPSPTAEQGAALPQSRRSATASKWGPTRNPAASAHGVSGRASNRPPQAARDQADAEALISNRRLQLAGRFPDTGVKTPRDFTITGAPLLGRFSSANSRLSEHANSSLSEQESGARSVEVEPPADEPPSSFINTPLLKQKSHTLFVGGTSPLAGRLHFVPTQRNKRRHSAERERYEKVPHPGKPDLRPPSSDNPLW